MSNELMSNEVLCSMNWRSPVPDHVFPSNLGVLRDVFSSAYNPFNKSCEEALFFSKSFLYMIHRYELWAVLGLTRKDIRLLPTGE